MTLSLLDVRAIDFCFTFQSFESFMTAVDYLSFNLDINMYRLTKFNLRMSINELLTIHIKSWLQLIRDGDIALPVSGQLRHKRPAEDHVVCDELCYRAIHLMRSSRCFELSAFTNGKSLKFFRWSQKSSLKRYFSWLTSHRDPALVFELTIFYAKHSCEICIYCN